MRRAAAGAVESTAPAVARRRVCSMRRTSMRERYEREDERPGRRPRDAGRRRDDTEPNRAYDSEGSEARRGGYRSDADRDDEGRADRAPERGDDWGDVQTGRWAGGRRPQPTDEPGRWERDESYWGGTSGRWSRDLEREPSSTRGYGGEERRWRYGAPDLDRDWQPERGSGRSA